MNKKQAIINYNEYMKVSRMYGQALATLSFDDSTGAPDKAFQERNEVINYFQTILFTRSISPEYQKIIKDLEKCYKSLSKKFQRIVDLSKKELEQNVKVPVEVMNAYQKACSDAFYYWQLAKNKGDYKIYKPYLENVIKYQKEVGNFFKKENQDLYDTFLDMYEEDINQVELDNFFNTIKARIVPLLKKIQTSEVVIRDDFLTRKIGKNNQMKMGKLIASKLGYDFTRGMVRESEHPFTNGLNNNDVRITTHIYENNFISNLFSMAHEGGHGIYEQNISSRLNNTILKNGASMSFHESQSRFFENIVARSEPFSRYFFPYVKKLSNGVLDDVSWEEYYLAINKVEPSFIRTEADELTYCLHVLIRYEIEKEMLKDGFDFNNLAELWNQKYKEYLGVEVTNDSHGVLQDVHWTSGVGYFFSYALGNAYSAQIYNAMKKDLDIDSLLENGDTKPIISWLKKHMYKYGCMLKPKDLIQVITNEPLNPEYYCKYLEEKYSKIYHL